MNFPEHKAKHWFFDFDGTLCDTERDIKEAWRATLADLKQDCPRFDELYVTGPSIDDMVALLLGRDKAVPEFVELVRATFRSHYDNDGFSSTVPYPGIVEWLDYLRDGGARLYIATNKRYVATKLLLAKFGWEKMFDNVYTSDKDPSRRLKKPAFLALALEENSIDPADAVMVGDTKLDVEAGNANGVFTIGVDWGYGKKGELDDASMRIASLI